MLYIITLSYQCKVSLGGIEGKKISRRDLIQSINSTCFRAGIEQRVGNSRYQKWKRISRFLERRTMLDLTKKLLEQFKEATRLETIIHVPRIIFTAGIRGSPSRPRHRSIHPPYNHSSLRPPSRRKTFLSSRNVLLVIERPQSPFATKRNRGRRKVSRGRIERQACKGDQGDRSTRNS